MVRKNIAIIGAGISGLIVANELKEIANITIFEKARGVGGRMSTRYKDDFSFDFGAQFFTAKTPEFIGYLEKFIDLKIVENWQANFVEIDGNNITYARQWNDQNKHFIASPKMNSLAKYLANDLDIKLQTKISRIDKKLNSLEIFDDKNNFCGEFDLMILTIPPQQALEILPKNFKYINDLQKKEMLPCFALMLGLANKPKLNWDCAYFKNSKLSWVAIENSKPSRNLSNCLTILSRNSWAADNIEADLQFIKNEMIAEFENLSNCKIGEILFSDIHRWKYANIAKQKGLQFYYDSENLIAICSDWLIQGRVESAYLSARSLIEELKCNLFKNV